jgi:hypothetical protein
MQQRGICTEPGCDRPVWSTGLCNSHYRKERRRTEALRHNYSGNPDSSDDFVRLMQGIVEAIKPLRMRYILYVQTGEGADHPHTRVVQMLLHLLRAKATVEQYNWVLRQVNEGLTEGNRIPMYYERKEPAHGSHIQQTPPDATEPEGAAGDA